VAPDHEGGSIPGLILTHIQMVGGPAAPAAALSARRIEDAKALLYQQLDPKQEPERAYTMLRHGVAGNWPWDRFDEPLDHAGRVSGAPSAIFRLPFYSSKNLIGMRLMGRPQPAAFDEQRATFDQLALLADPSSETLREIVVGTLANEAFYKGAAHHCANGAGARCRPTNFCRSILLQDE
jgi:hypothetical protein